MFMKKIVALLVVWIISVSAEETEMQNGAIQPMVVEQFLDRAKANSNWKMAFATGKYEQIVFMNISPATNPDNEIGTEVHPFDQVILIASGKGNALINGKTTQVGKGDMIFIPAGTSHNVVNLGGQKELKIISFYSATDIPKNAVYKKKGDESNE